MKRFILASLIFELIVAVAVPGMAFNTQFEDARKSTISQFDDSSLESVDF